MSTLTLGVVIGAGLQGAFGTVFKKASGEVNTLGQAIKDLRKQESAVQKVIGQQDALGKLGGEMQALQARMAGARDALEAARSAHTALTGSVKVARQEHDRYAAAVTGSQQPTQEQIQGYMRAKERLAQLESQYATSSNAVRNSRNEVKKAEAAAASLDARQQKLTGAIGQSIEKLRSAGIATSDLRQEEARLGAELEKTLAAQEELNQKMERRSAAAGATLLGIGKTVAAAKMIGGAFAPAVNSAMDFETAMVSVRKVVNFDTPEQFAQMAKDISALSGEIPMTAEEIAEIVAAGGQAGFARDELLGYAEAAAKMGIAFDVTANQAGEMMANWRTSFSMGQDAVGELADQINFLGNTGTVKAKAISEIVTRIGTLGEVAGIGAAQVAAIGATMNGIAPETAATGIKRLLLVLNSGSAATGEQQKAFKALGLSATDLAQDMQDDAARAIVTVMERIQALDPTEQTAALQELFGSGSVEAIAPLLGNLDRLRENLGKVGDATRYVGSMEKEYASVSATTANNVKLMGGNFSRVGKIIGSVFMPPMNWAVGVLGAAAGRLADLAEEFPGVTTGIVGIGAVLAGLVVGWLAWNTVVAAGTFALTFFPGIAAAVSGSMAIMKTAFIIGAGAVRVLTTALLFNPIGLAITAIALGAGLIIAYWEPIKGFFGGLFEWIGQKVEWVVAKFQTVMGVAGKIGSMLGFGDDDTGATAAVAGAPGRRVSAAEASINRVAAASPAATGRAGTNVSQTSNYQIAVHATPGMDEKALAAAVHKELDTRDRQQAARQRGSLYDRD